MIKIAFQNIEKTKKNIVLLHIKWQNDLKMYLGILGKNKEVKYLIINKITHIYYIRYNHIVLLHII